MALGVKWFMLVVSVSKTSKVLPALMACLLAMVAVVCLVHTDGIADSQTAHQGHRHTSSSSAAHLTLDLHCLVAILPGVVVLVWLPLRIRWMRRAGSAKRLRNATAGRDLLALRALATQPLGKLVKIDPEIAALWRKGDKQAVEALASLELRSLGLR